MKGIKTNISFLFIVITLLTSCSITKNIPDNNLLLKKVKVEDAPKEYQDDLYELVLQKPNRKFLGVYPFYLKSYYFFDNMKDKKINRNLKKAFGEPPIYLDSSKTQRSTVQMETFLINHGYLQAKVNYEIKTPQYMINFLKVGKKKKRAGVVYNIIKKKQYKINAVEYYIPDRFLDSLIQTTASKSLIKVGEFYNSETLIAERERITEFLRNRGFYKFNRDYIYFEVDTSYAGEYVKVGVGVTNPDVGRHNTYKVNKIYIEPTYKFADTTRKDTVEYHGYYFIEKYKFILPQVLLNQITIKPGQGYSAQDIKTTINKLSQLQIFKFIDISFENEVSLGNNRSKVDAFIRLTPEQKMGFVAETELTTTEQDVISADYSSRYFGIAPSLSYRNKNLFKRGLLWELKLSGAYEISNDFLVGGNTNNLYEYGGNTSITYPNAFLPRILFKKQISRSYQTTFNLSYLFEGNFDFRRSTGSFSYGYQFTNKLTRHIVIPMDISRVKTENISSGFSKILAESDNEFLQSIFKTYLIPGARYTLVYNERPYKSNHYFFIRWDVLEIAGNTFWLYNKLIKENPVDTAEHSVFKYKIGNIGFYQYAKTNLDIRYYLTWQKNNVLAFRFAPGIGIPYLNTQTMPFERRFYVGGSNSIRAWSIRSLGPGTYKEKNNNLNFISQVGDIKLEGNVEYRFDITYIFKGAFFVDWGNIWTVKKEADKPGGVFQSDFYKEIAIGAGTGLRLDFTFFIFRFDFAWPMYDPEIQDVKQRWQVDNITFPWLAKNVRLNIGIGYPF